MKLRISAEAKADIKEAAKWYEAQQAGLGKSFVSTIKLTTERISQGPHRFPRPYRNVQRALTGRFPYAVFYEAFPSEVVVIGVLHQNRDPSLLDERLK